MQQTIYPWISILEIIMFLTTHFRIKYDLPLAECLIKHEQLK